MRGAAVALAALVLSPSFAHAQQNARFTDVARVVVFADVHGAYEPLVELLRATGVLGGDLAWTGGATHLVSLGDLLDRGPDSRKVLDLMMRLQGEALEDGGRVHVVLGNHELMNLVGDWRYVTAADYAAFAAEEADAVRDSAYLELAAAAAQTDTAAATREGFEQMYPRGYFARRAAFAAQGRYGAWLLGLPAVVVVNDIAYVHGSLPPIVAEQGLALNDKVPAIVRRYLEVHAGLAAEGVLPPTADPGRAVELARAALPGAAAELAARLEELIALDEAPEIGSAGPLWSRRSVYCKPMLERPNVEAALERLDVARAVVGHTPTGDRHVRALYGGQLVMLDTGMLASYFGGRATALVLDGGDVYVQYAAPLQRGAIETAGATLAHGRTEAELRVALERGTITAVDRGAGGDPWRVALRHEDAAIEALFYAHGAAGGELELAGAALDDLLGTALVPPTIERAIEGERGALQLLFPDSLTEAARLERGMGFAGWCPIEPQVALMYAFDVLTFNRGRTARNVFYNNELSDMTITDQRLAFGPERSLPPSFDPSRLMLAPLLVDALRVLDEPKLEAALGQWLDARRIRALLARRDRLVRN
jgi:3',5'-cyclic AMP phosphodiesterase CpdA